MLVEIISCLETQIFVNRGETMSTKSDLLRQLGWDDTLIEHFLISDEYIEKTKEDLLAEVFDTNSMTITYNAGLSGSSVKISMNNTDNSSKR